MQYAQAMKKTSCAVIGFFVAPLVASVALTAGAEMRGVSKLIMMLGLLPIVYYFVTVLTFIFAVPAYFLLSRYGLVNLRSILISGMAMGVLGSIISRLPNAPNFHDFIGTVPVGALAAFCFWLIWRKGR
jgi:VIT1/CCC1 family predicted Fe2+/Mn2+ transporter